MLNSEASILTVDTGVAQSFEGDDRGGIHLLLWAMAMQLRMDRTATQCRLVCEDIQNLQTLHTDPQIIYINNLISTLYAGIEKHQILHFIFVCTRNPDKFASGPTSVTEKIRVLVLN